METKAPPHLEIGRIYRVTNTNKSVRTGGFFKPIQKLNDEYFNIISFNANNPRRRSTTRVAHIRSLLGYGPEIVAYDNEPEGFNSEEGARLLEAKQAKAKAAALAAELLNKSKSKKNGSKAAGGPPQKKLFAHDKARRPASVFFAADIFAEIEAFRATQQAESDARGDGAEVSTTEAIRRLVRIGLASRQVPSVAKAAE